MINSSLHVCLSFLHTSMKLIFAFFHWVNHFFSLARNPLYLKSPGLYTSMLTDIIDDLSNKEHGIETCVNKKLNSLSFHLKDVDECFGKGIHNSVYAPFRYKDDQMVVNYPHSYPILINEPSFCKDPPTVLIVHSSPFDGFAARHVLRSTFGSIESVDNVTIKSIFIVGTNKNSTLLETIKQESSLTHDIIVYDFQDSFLNITLGTMLAMEWTLQFCSKAQYYIASDTDTWINVPYIVGSVLPSCQDTHGKQIFAGYQINNGKPIRNPLSRYYISTTVYPNETFPPYPTGCFYLFSIDALEQFYQLSKTVKPALYFNDVFLGLINQQAHIPFRNYRYPELFYNRMPYSPKTFFTNHMASHRYTLGDLLFLWSQFLKSNSFDEHVHLKSL